MSGDKKAPFDSLREKAEARLKATPPPEGPLSGEEARRLVHELQVHRIELEIQNEELRQSRQTAEESRDRYLQLYHIAPVGYIVVDASGIVRQVNRTLAEMVGADASDFLHHPLSRHLHPRDRGIFLSRFKAFFRNPAGKHLEIRFSPRKGNTLFARLEGRKAPAEIFPAEEKGEGLLLVSVTDITANKEAEEASKRASMIVNNTSAMVFSWENAPGWPVELVSENVDRLLGYTMRDFTSGRISYDRIIHPEDLDRVLAEVKRFSSEAGRETFRHEPYRVVTRQGECRWVDDLTRIRRNREGAITHYEGLVIDITERKEAADALAQARAELDQIFNVATPMCLIDRNYRMLRVNDTFCGYFNVHREQAVGRPCHEILGGEVCGTARCMLERALTGKLESACEADGKGKDGREISYIVTGKPFLNAAGEVTGVVESFTDITERKRAEARRLELEQQLQQRKKEESLGRMAGAIAHHFNNLLAAVMGNLELALYQIPEETDLREYLSSSMQASRRAVELSRLMLTYLGQTPLKKEPMDLSEACEEAAALLEASLPDRVRLRTHLSGPGPFIRADGAHVRQVLIHLLTNAAEALGEEEGSVRVSADTVDASTLENRHFFPPGWKPKEKAYARLTVADDGCGMDAPTLEKIFDPFFTTKFTGRGLGLAVVLGGVRSHEGAIAVESEPGKGSVFRVFFPALQQDAQQPANDEKAPIRLPESGGKVLLAEDEPMVRRVASTMLSRLGFQVTEAENGLEALERFRARKDEYLLVILDLTMPHMNGWEALQALRASRPGIPVILASGFEKSQVMRGDHPELPQAFLHKPFHMENLRSAIETALEKLPRSEESFK